MRTLSLILLVVLATLINPSTSYAQSQSTDCGCNAALAKDLISVIATDRQQYAFLSLIDQRTFEEYKSNTNLLASIPIAKVLVEASANFSEFQQRRTSYFQQVQYSSNIEREYRELQNVTSPVAYGAWASCMESCAKGRTGLFAWKESENQSSLVVKVYYHGAPGAEPALISSSLQGATAVGAPDGKVFPAKTRIPNNGTISAIINRQGNKAITGIVSAAGFSADTIFSEWRDAASDNTATLKLRRPRVVETPLGTWCQISGWTGGNSNKKCNHAPCSPEGKFQATAMPVTLNAQPGNILRNPRFTRCWRWAFSFSTGLREVEGGEACGGWWSVDSITVAPGETSITGVFRAWSNPTKREFCADLIRVTQQTGEDSRTVRIPPGGTFTFEVPGEYESSLLEYRINGTSGVMQPGLQTTPDGVLQLVARVPVGGATFYQYRIL